MSSQTKSEPVSSSAPSTKNKKKHKKKKAGANKAEGNVDPITTNGAKDVPDTDTADGDADADEADLPTKTTPPQTPLTDATSAPEPSEPDEMPEAENQISSKVNGIPPEPTSQDDTDLSETQHRLDAMTQERDRLKGEVAELRKSIEDIQGRHEDEATSLQEQLEESEAGRERAETQYSTLLERVNDIKAQLGQRLKADAEELAQARMQIEELEEQSREAAEEKNSLQAELSRLSAENKRQAQEVSELRGRANLSQQNWIKERDELISREAYAREEWENARQAMQDWEVLAMEERSLRENLNERVSELEDQLLTQREAYERAASERDSQSATVDGLQRALQDIQDARKKELREMVEHSQAQLEELRKQLQAAEEASKASKAALEASQKELERALPFEKEVKEKNLLIGKLRHEAVILNDHLTKALRFLKQRKPEDMVDRQLVTNHFLHFLALDRSDPKKFQILQLIAALLAWTDEQKEQAGLARPGASMGSLRIPMSPFRRTPSTPSLNSDLMLSDGGASKESLAELWSDFLEREASEGKGGSRRGSSASHASRGTEKGPPSGLGIS